MPQKRNPVSVEHARSIGSRALGEAMGVLIVVHNTPFGDIVDTEDDLQPVVSSVFWDATRAMKLVAAAMRGATFDREKAATRAAQGWITLTELADALARDHGLPFQIAHKVGAALMHESIAHPARPLAEILAEVSTAIAGQPIRYTDEGLREVLSPTHFVEIRKTLGGPAIAETTRALEESRGLLAGDREWLTGTRAALAAASAHLRARREAL
jgi:argininosuccinate lyase